MNLLQEIIGYYNLTDTQKTVLVASLVSGTPQQAYEFTIGNPSLVQARNTLVRIGLVNVQRNEMGITPKGQEAARNYNLVDASGQLTPDATNLMNKATGDNSEANATPMSAEDASQ